MSTFPPDTLTSATLPFWSWPKLPPSPLQFDPTPGSEHLQWVFLVAKALSAAVGVQVILYFLLQIGQFDNFDIMLALPIRRVMRATLLISWPK